MTVTAEVINQEFHGKVARVRRVVGNHDQEFITSIHAYTTGAGDFIIGNELYGDVLDPDMVEIERPGFVRAFAPNINGDLIEYTYEAL